MGYLPQPQCRQCRENGGTLQAFLDHQLTQLRAPDQQAQLTAEEPEEVPANNSTLQEVLDQQLAQLANTEPEDVPATCAPLAPHDASHPAPANPPSPPAAPRSPTA